MAHLFRSSTGKVPIDNHNLVAFFLISSPLFFRSRSPIKDAIIISGYVWEVLLLVILVSQISLAILVSQLFAVIVV